MPLFGRADGELVRGLAPVRAMLPFLMPTRNEAVVYYEQVLDLRRTLPFLEEWNRTHEAKLTVFHLVVAAIGKALYARPGLDRFVAGGRIWQRRTTSVAFAAKKAFRDDAPIVTVKLDLARGEALEATAARVLSAVSEGRSGRERAVDREVALGVALPGFVLRFVLFLLRKLDAWNLLPGALLRGDPMYASVFLANLGSVGLDRAFHHLFEYGTCSVFAVLGAVKKRVVVGDDGAPAVRDTVRLRYSFDERINDGFYCASSLEIVRFYVEDPARFASWLEAPADRDWKPSADAL